MLPESRAHFEDTHFLLIAYLRSLVYPNMKARFHDIQDAGPDTCDWLFDTDIFSEWKTPTCIQKHNGVLWIKGKPGSGKSTLMKHSLIRFETMFCDHHVAAYFFNARGDILEKSPSGMLRSFTYQLLDIDEMIYNHFANYFPEKTRMDIKDWIWRPSELEGFLRSVVETQQAKPLLLLVDALDECDISDVRKVVGFLESLSKKATRCRSSLKICLSSRHYPTINMEKKLELIIENSWGHSKDIIRYVGDKLRVRDQEIEQEIFDKANGVFMWVVLVVIRLNEAYDDGLIESMKSALAEVPADLEDLFDAILMNSTPMQSETISMLQWVLLSNYPLTPEELFAIVVGPFRYPREIIERRITASSRGLVEIRRGDEDTLQFIHQSVVDFLTRNGRLQKLDPTLGQEAIMASHARLWSCCLKYSQHVNTTFTNGTNVESLVNENIFLDYATSAIFFHAEMSLSFSNISQSDYNRVYSGHTHSEVRNSSLTSIVSWLRDQKYLFESFGGYRMYRGCYLQRHDGKGVGLLYVLSELGCTKLIRLIIKEVDINAQGGHYGNALQAAAYEGRNDTVQLLLDNGADVNVQGGHYGNALQAAAFQGRKDIMQLLIDRGADINAQGGLVGNALQAAAYQGRNEAVQLLLDHGADVNAQGGRFGNALQAAACLRNEGTMQLLIDRGLKRNE